MLASIARSLIIALARIGAEPQDDDILRTRKIIFASLLLAGIAFCGAWAATYAALGQTLAAAILFGQAAVALMGLLVFAGRLLNYRTLRIVERALALVAPCLVTLSLGGFGQASGFAVWGVVAPLGAALFGEKPDHLMRWTATYMAALLTVALAAPFIPAPAPLPPRIISLFFAINFGLVSALVLAVVYYFVFQRNRAFERLNDEEARSEQLLLNILPPEIAALLKKQPQTVADYFDEVSILFADVVNFTPLAAQLSPIDLVDLLNELFSHFDTLVEKYDLEKIKTIGDCYMVASGVPRPRSDHAQALAHMALDLRDSMGRFEFHGRPLSFRIGINSGPVVAGVIGHKKFTYDLWGDAVNIASRMESHGVSGAIQITRATYNLIKDDFVCEARGPVAMKGLGEVEVWHLIGPRSVGQGPQ